MSDGHEDRDFEMLEDRRGVLAVHRDRAGAQRARGPGRTVRVKRQQDRLLLAGSVRLVDPGIRADETVMGFGMFALLWAFRNHPRKYGWLFGMYLILAGTERFVVEFFRAKDDRYFAGLTVAQVISAALVVIGVGIMIWKWGQRAEPGVRARS